MAVCVYPESVCIYYLEFVFILRWFAFIFAGVSIYPPQLVFILGKPKFVFILDSFYLLPQNLYLLFIVSVYYTKFMFILEYFIFNLPPKAESKQISICVYYLKFVLS